MEYTNCEKVKYKVKKFIFWEKDSYLVFYKCDRIKEKELRK